MNLFKTKFFIATLLICALFFYGCKEKQSSQQWYKGSLHTHSLWSDGDTFPEMVMNWHKSHGYHFVALSDHNSLEDKEKWEKISESSAHQQAFINYQSKYGENWIECKKDTGGIQVKLKTFKEFKPLFEETGKFLIIQSEEISDRFEGKPIHLNAINLQKLIRPQKSQSVADVLQKNIDVVTAQGRKTGVPMIVQINHPNYKYALSVQDMITLRDIRFFEVHNGYSPANNDGDSIHPSTEVIWDQINIAFLKQGKPLLYGVASDDSHHYQVFNSKNSNPGRAWVMVKASELTTKSLIEAMMKGDFYASTGISLKEVLFRNNQLKISVEAEPGVNYRIQFIGCKVKDKETTILKETDGREATFDLNKNILFARAKIISDKLKENPFCEGDYKMAWSQPVRHY